MVGVQLQSRCVANSTTWNKMQLYNIPDGGKGATAECFTDYTAEFLLTRGPYAMLVKSDCVLSFACACEYLLLVGY